MKMDLRVLRYFLTVAKEQSFTKAARQLHITQPTLSRQLAALEEELGTALFDRSGHSITLTEKGILLKRRALEIIDLEDQIVEEFKGSEEVIEGKITIGCGEFAAVEMLAEICKSYQQSYPMVQIALHTGTADTIFEMMNKGLVDIGLFMEPVNTEGLAYIRLPESDSWVVGMRPDDPLAQKRSHYKRRSFRASTDFAGAHRRAERACKLVWKRFGEASGCIYEQPRDERGRDGDARPGLPGFDRRRCKILGKKPPDPKASVPGDQIGRDHGVAQEYSVFPGGAEDDRKNAGI